MKGTLLFNALREAIDEEMARDPLVCVMGEDVGQYGGSYKVTKDLYEKYGEFRVLDTPIALSIASGFKTLIIGISFLATFTFGFIGLGLFLVFIRSLLEGNKEKTD